jgi:hypothetical protein
MHSEMVTMIDSAEKDLLRKPLGFFFFKFGSEVLDVQQQIYKRGEWILYMLCGAERERERNACVQRKRAVSPILLVICHNNPEL